MKRIYFLIVLFATVAVGNAVAGDIFSLRPRPKAAFTKSGIYAVYSTSFLIRPNTPTQMTWAAIEYLQRSVKRVLGDTLLLIKQSQYIGGGGIFVGEYPDVSYRLTGLMPPGEIMPGPQGYVIDITTDQIVVAGSDTDGTFNGVATLVQLLKSGANVTVQNAHIWDVPDYPQRWARMTSQGGMANDMGFLRSLTDSLSYYKLNGVIHADAEYGSCTALPQAFSDSAKSLRTVGLLSHVEIIPEGMGTYAQILSSNPNLAEGAPVTQSYVIRSDTGVELLDSRVALPNGDFESAVNASILTGLNGWTEIDTPNVTVFLDSVTVHGGQYSARFANLNHSSTDTVRTVKHMLCSPRKSYFLSAWIRTSNFSGTNPELLVIGSDTSGNRHTLTSTNFQLPSTSGWVHVQTPFNTLNFTSLDISCAVVGGATGTVWWDDVQILDAGLANVLRRGGTPWRAMDKHTNTVRVEGTDFVTVADTILNNGHAAYGTYHAPPTLKRITGGAVANGDTLIVTCYEPLVTAVKTDGTCSAMVCVSEDSLYTLLKANDARVDSLLHPLHAILTNTFPTALNWDTACTSRHSTPGDLWASYDNRSDSVFQLVHAAERNLAATPIFDSLQLTYPVDNFFNGPLHTGLNSVRKAITMKNGTDFGSHLAFFKSHGFSQMADVAADNEANIGLWRSAQDTVGAMLGGFYNTTTNSFTHLAHFADAYWSAGAFINHTPIDSTVLNADTVRFSATIYPDVDDVTDTVTLVTVEILDANGVVVQTDTLPRYTGNLFVGKSNNPNRTGFRYRLKAVDKEGFTRAGVLYFVGAEIFSSSMAVPKLAAPGIDSTCLPLNPVLSWNTTAGATTYHVQVSSKVDFSTIVFERATITQLQIQASGLVNEHQYWWRIRSEQGNNYGNWSTVRQFTTIAAVPEMKVPLDSSIILGSEVTCGWLSANNATQYAFAIDTFPDFHSNTPVSTTSQLTFTPTVQTGHTYYWRVMVNDNGMCGPWSPTRRFTMVDSLAVPHKVDLIAPSGNMIIDSVHTFLTFRWKRGTKNPDQYELYVRSDSDSTALPVDQIVSDTSSTIIFPIPYSAFWIVRAHNSAGWGDYSDTLHFSLARPTAVNDQLPLTNTLTVTAMPNPFVSSTTIRVGVATPTQAEIVVTDFLGNTVARLHNGWLSQGDHDFKFDASHLPQGPYFYRLSAPQGNVVTILMVVR